MYKKFKWKIKSINKLLPMDKSLLLPMDKSLLLPLNKSLLLHLNKSLLKCKNNSKRSDFLTTKLPSSSIHFSSLVRRKIHRRPHPLLQLAATM